MITTLNSNCLLLPTCKGVEVIDISSIIRIEAISNYSRLYFSNGKTLVVAKLLHWFEKTLTPGPSPQGGEGSCGFHRIHRTHIVNKNFIRCYHSRKVKLLNGELIDVAKRKKNYFLKCWYAAA
jgi:two-component system LytT family response regulator